MTAKKCCAKRLEALLSPIPLRPDQLFEVVVSLVIHKWMGLLTCLTLLIMISTYAAGVHASGVGKRLFGVQYIDPLHGWAFGDNGAIFATTDAGATWQQRDSGVGKRLFGVQYADPLHGWAFGENGTILTTTDAGGTWHQLDSGVSLSGGRSDNRDAASRDYPQPGRTGDPWGPYIREASSRFEFPESTIRRVMHQESRGRKDARSQSGAMGLMQVMPRTYNELRAHYGLGDDPYDPHNNILAGVAYLRQLYDRYGPNYFIAAYNAGPGRVDSYLTRGVPLPDETVEYVRLITSGGEG